MLTYAVERLRQEEEQRGRGRDELVAMREELAAMHERQATDATELARMHARQATDATELAEIRDELARMQQMQQMQHPMQQMQQMQHPMRDELARMQERHHEHILQRLASVTQIHKTERARLEVS
jgi:hypothetical protein